MLNWLKSLFGSDPSNPQDEPRERMLVPHIASVKPPRKETGRTFPQFRIARGAEGDRPLDIQAKLRQSFGSAQPVSDARFFAGRQETLQRIITALEGEGTHVVLYGERGIGKTSILHVLSDIARKARYEVVYDSCSGDTRFDTISRSILSRIPLIYHKETPLVSDAVESGESFAKLLTDKPVGAREMSDLLTQVVGTRVLVILDEYDRVEDKVFRRQTAELIKNLSDRVAPVHLLIAGVAEDLDELIDYIPSIRRNIAAIEIPAMTSDEIREIIRIGSETAGIGFDEGGTDRIIYYANGSPYVARLICLHAAMEAQRLKAGKISSEIVDNAARRVVREWHDRMPSLIKRKIDSGQQMDLLLAASFASHVNHSRFSIEDIRNAYISVGSVPPVDLARRVESSDLIKPEGEGEDRLYRLIDPGLGAYLRMQAKLPPEDSSATMDLTKAVG